MEIWAHTITHKQIQIFWASQVPTEVRTELRRNVGLKVMEDPFYQREDVPSIITKNS